jgi:ABC-type Zn uptake system ZnuABC Zn-binding protein ZnuA
MKRLFTTAVWCIAAFLTVADSGAAERKIDVVVTNSILADWVNAVGKEKVSVHSLVGANSDVHTFEPAPQDGIAIAKANVIINFGMGLEPWLKELYKSSGSKAHRYTVTDGVNFIYLTEHKEHGMFREEADPHIWHDPTNAIKVVQGIATALVNEDPKNAQFYWGNSRAYIDELVKIDGWIIKQLRKIPEERRKIVTSHDTFAYYAKRYGFEVIGSVIDSATTEAADPSAQKIAELIEKVKASGAPAIFLENTSNSKIAQSVAQETGVKIAPRLYSDALGEAGSEADTYLKMMEYNTQVFADALKK